MKILFIDDIRHFSEPWSVKYRESLGLRYFTEEELEVLKTRPTPSNGRLVVARNYDEAIAHLSTTKFDLVFFDHDLGGEKTGMDVAKWVVQNCKEKFLHYVHSANPVGRENIDSLLTQFFRQLQ